MDGILLVDKPASMTSFDVVYKIRKALHIKSVGHTGTLDPQATGLLIVLLGRACKALPYLSGATKEYIAELRLGEKTDTGDIWGKCIETKEYNLPSKEQCEEVLQSFLGLSSQIPPMVSAIKKDGKRLYEYAREGIEVQREPREIEIKEIELLNIEPIRFRVVCSTGTYIRSLCEDIAVKLNTVGTMSSLVRTQASGYHLNQASTLTQIQEGSFQLVSLYEGISTLYPCVQVNEKQMKDVKNGKTLQCQRDEQVLAICFQQEVLAMYEKKAEGCYQCRRGLW